MASVKIAGRYRPHQEDFSFKTVGESKTQQQFKAECDVNNIMAKYKKTGMLTHLSKYQGQFGDFSGYEDYQTSLAKLDQAQRSFNDLPSEIRSKFFNDPGKLIEYLSDEKNHPEAVKLGLMVLNIPEPTIAQEMETALAKNDQKRESNKPKESKS